jgi:hypothetical protein
MEREPRGKGDAPPDATHSAAQFLPSAVVDSFSHDRHKKLACTTCHDPASQKSTLTFEAPRGCQICHHQAPARSDCASCHTSDDLSSPRETQVSVAAAGRAARSRTIGFSHARHSQPCTTCHVASVTLAVADSVGTCLACHGDHHAVERSCAACHREAEQLSAAHDRASHEGCAACHLTTAVRELSPVRSFCLACHDDSRDHYREQECSACHFQGDPAVFKQRLTTALERP